MALLRAETPETDDIRAAKRQKLKDFLTFTRVLPGRSKSRVSHEEASHLLVHARALQGKGDNVNGNVARLNRSELRSLLVRSEAQEDPHDMFRLSHCSMSYRLASPQHKRRLTPVHDAGAEDLSLAQLAELHRTPLESPRHLGMGLGAARQMPHPASPVPSLVFSNSGSFVLGSPSENAASKQHAFLNLTPDHRPIAEWQCVPQFALDVAAPASPAGSPANASGSDSGFLLQKQGSQGKQHRRERRTAEEVRQQRNARIDRSIRSVAHMLGFEATATTVAGSKGRCRSSSVDNMAAHAELLRSGGKANGLSSLAVTSAAPLRVSGPPVACPVAAPAGSYTLGKHPHGVWGRGALSREGASGDLPVMRLDFSTNLTSESPLQAAPFPTHRPVVLHSRKEAGRGIARLASKWLPNASGDYA